MVYLFQENSVNVSINETGPVKSENMLDSGIKLYILCRMVVIAVFEHIGMVFVFTWNVKSMKPHDVIFEDFLGILIFVIV